MNQTVTITPTNPVIDRQYYYYDYSSMIRAQFQYAVDHGFPCRLYINEYKPIGNGRFAFIKTNILDGTIIDFSNCFITARLSDGTLKKVKRFEVIDKDGNKLLDHVDLKWI